MLPSHYDPILVAISFVIAILAAWTALNMAGRVSTSQRRAVAGQRRSPEAERVPS